VFFPLLFLTPNFVPFDRLTSLMRTLAHLNPVSYVLEALRSLVLEGWVVHKLLLGLLVIVVTALVLTGLSVRAIETYDR
jgi:ABC-2 type transport system permease protein